MDSKILEIILHLKNASNKEFQMKRSYLTLKRKNALLIYAYFGKISCCDHFNVSSGDSFTFSNSCLN